jgi:hypothetical protein
VGDFNSVSSNYILALLEDAHGNIWIGTSSGLNKLDIYTQRFSLFAHEGDRESGLSNATVLSLCEDKRGRFWVGTRNGLNLFDRDALSFKVFREKDGLPDHNIISILDDEKGNLWISTLNGLSNLVPDSVTGEMSFRNFDRLDGLQGLEFNEHSALKTSRGELIFGGANGFNIFNPLQIVGNHDYYDVLLTDLRLLNKSVEIGHNIREHQVLKKALNLTSEIALKHNQDVFSIEFAALNYFHPERTRFRYRLDGFNTDWIETDAANRTATYTNLNPGTYTFRVQASGSDGSWSADETRLSVVVIPPFYATQWAYSLYFVLMGYPINTRDFH